MSNAGDVVLNKPRLKRYLTVFPITEQEWGIRGGFEELLRIRPKTDEGVQAMQALLPLLDGSRELPSILAALEQQGIRETTARSLLALLQEKSLLEDAEVASADGEGAPPQLLRQRAFFSRYAADGGDSLQQKLRESRVGLVCGSGLGTVLLRQLQDSGIGWILALHLAEAGSPSQLGLPAPRAATSSQISIHPLDLERIWPDEFGSLPHLFVVALDAYDPGLLEAMERFSFERNVPWLLVQITSTHEASVGPIFIPRQSACYSCMEGRLLSNLRFPTEYLAFREYLKMRRVPSAPVGGLVAYHELVAGVTVIEGVKFLTGYAIPQLVGRILAFDTSNWTSELHDVLRLPQCRCRLDQPTFFPWKDASYAKRQGSRS